MSQKRKNYVSQQLLHSIIIIIITITLSHIRTHADTSFLILSYKQRIKTPTPIKTEKRKKKHSARKCCVRSTSFYFRSKSGLNMYTIRFAEKSGMFSTWISIVYMVLYIPLLCMYIIYSSLFFIIFISHSLSLSLKLFF